MRTVSAVLAALLSVIVLAPAALAANSNRDDARVTSGVQAAVGSVDTTEGPLSGTLESLEGVPLGAGSELRAQVVATNSSDVALEEVVLRLDVTREPLTTRGELAEFMADPTSARHREALQEPPGPEPESDADGAPEASADVAGAAASVTSGTVPADNGGENTASYDTDEVDQEVPEPVGLRIAPRSEAAFTLTASPADLDLPAQGWGVYGAAVTLVTPTTEVLVDSFPLTWGAQAVPQLDLAVLATATGVPSQVLNVLQAADLPGVAVLVDPTHLTTAQVISHDLRNREVFRMPVHTPDLTSIAHSGNDNLMPLALALPDSNEITAVSSAPWLAVPAHADAQSVALATDLGASAVLVLPSTAGFERLTTIADGPVVQASGTPMLLPDPVLSDTVEHFRPGAPAAAALAIADSALLASQRDGAPALVTLEPDWHIGAHAPATLSALLNTPWVQPLPVTDLLDHKSQAVGLSQDMDTSDNLPEEQLERIGNRLDQLAVLATVAEAPEAALNEWGRELLRGTSVANRGDHFAQETALQRALDQADATLSAVRIADSSDLNLLAESGDIPVNVVNGLDREVTVAVTLHSFSSNLQVLHSPTVTVPPATDQVVLVPVEAVSNANVFIAAELQNTDGERISDTQPFSVRVRADWGNAATAVFTVVLVLLLIAGLIRTIRRGRKDTRVDPSDPPETMVGDDG